MSLRGERVLLRYGDPADAASMAALQARNQAHFQPWEPSRPEGYFTEAFWRQQLAREHAARAKGQMYRYLVFLRGAPDEVIAWAGFSNVVRGAFQSCHLGFGLDEAHVGQGLMHEALRLALDDVFGRLRLHRVEANHRPDNVRSEGLLTRLGFERIGYAPNYLRIDGAWRDHVLRARVNPDWRP